MKKIRVAWNDLKPGDLIHVKGSKNTYRFVSYGSGTISGDPEKVTPKKAKQYAFVDIQAAVVHPYGRCFYTELKLVVLDSDFDYATRPAPKKPHIEEPVSPGEYWARIQIGEGETWVQIIKVYVNDYVRLSSDNDKRVYQISGHVEVRVYDTEETMRRAACIDLVESSIESDDLDRPIGDAAFENGTAGITLMQSAPIDTQTNVVKYGNSPMCVIYLSREHLLPHIVSHECVHAAMGLYNVEILGYRHKAKACKHMTVSNELVAYAQSELFRCVMEFLADAVKTTEEEQ